MNCAEFEAELADRADAALLRLSEAAQRHRDDCDACRRLWTADFQLEPLIAAWRAAVPHPPSAERVVSALLIDRAAVIAIPSRTPVPRAVVLASMISAAAVLLCVGLAVSRPAGPPRPDGRVLAHRQAESAVEPTIPISDSVATLWGLQSRSLEAAVETVRRLEEWPQVAVHHPAAQAARPSDETLSSSPGWLQWGEPLGRQVGQAFQFLGDALPDPNEGPAG